MNYTEEDTFNKLRKTSIQEMYSVYNEHFWKFYKDRDMYLRWLEEHMWAELEFFEAAEEYRKKLLDIGIERG